VTHLDGVSSELDGLLAALGEKSTVSAKVDALMATGFSRKLIGQAVNASPTTITRWLDGALDNSNRGSEKLMNLNVMSGAMRTFINAGLSLENARAWFLSRTNLPPDVPRPIDLLSQDRSTVARLAGELVLSLEHQQGTA
jgi:hypothetical protein